MQFSSEEELRNDNIENTLVCDFAGVRYVPGVVVNGCGAECALQGVHHRADTA
jgi:hypothetical protein